MFRHIVLITVEPSTDDSVVSSIAASLRALPAQIPEIRSYVVGIDAALNPGNATLAVVAGFDDAAGYLTYRDHPEHRRVIDEQISPAQASRTAIQFEE